MQSLQKKEQGGHAQWPVLFVELGQFVRKKESFLLKTSFTLSFLVWLLLKQQEL
jgi:hypothetical protein